MSASFRCILLLIVGLAGCPWVLSAQDAQNASLPPMPPAMVPVPPPPTSTKSPVDIFRRLLAMSPAERERDLANRTEENRRRILAKIQEYEAMKPDDREVRLRMTEMHWYLVNLMQAPSTNRAAQLAAVSESIREPVADRLKLWDNLSPELQKEFRGHEITTSWFTGSSLPPLPPGMTNTVYKSVEPGKIKAGLAIWNVQPPQLRQKMLLQVGKFFTEFTDDERQKILKTLSPEERQQMESALHSFDKLPPAQRELCIKSFGKLAGLNDQEREQFLRNAERWHDMSPAERQAWRNLVTRFPEPPPVPPGFLPPSPPGLIPQVQPRSALPPSPSRTGLPLASTTNP